jgi:hypothetical protein
MGEISASENLAFAMRGGTLEEVAWQQQLFSIKKLK